MPRCVAVMAAAIAFVVTGVVTVRLSVAVAVMAVTVAVVVLGVTAAGPLRWTWRRDRAR